MPSRRTHPRRRGRSPRRRGPQGPPPDRAGPSRAGRSAAEGRARPSRRRRRPSRDASGRRRRRARAIAPALRSPDTHPHLARHTEAVVRIMAAGARHPPVDGKPGIAEQARAERRRRTRRGWWRRRPQFLEGDAGIDPGRGLGGRRPRIGRAKLRHRRRRAIRLPSGGEVQRAPPEAARRRRGGAACSMAIGRDLIAVHFERHRRGPFLPALLPALACIEGHERAAHRRGEAFLPRRDGDDERCGLHGWQRGREFLPGHLREQGIEQRPVVDRRVAVAGGTCISADAGARSTRTSAPSCPANARPWLFASEAQTTRPFSSAHVAGSPAISLKGMRPAGGAGRSQAGRVAGGRATRRLRNAKGDPSGSPSLLSQELLVAGVGFEPTTFRL